MTGFRRVQGAGLQDSVLPVDMRAQAHTQGSKCYLLGATPSPGAWGHQRKEVPLGGSGESLRVSPLPGLGWHWMGDSLTRAVSVPEPEGK